MQGQRLRDSADVDHGTASAPDHEVPPPAPRETGRRPLAVVAAICALGIALTAVSTWAAARVDRNAEERLLQVQTRQAASVLSTAALVIQQPLATALSAQSAIGPGGDASLFRRSMSASVGAEAVFVSAGLWRQNGTTFSQVALVGVDPGTSASDPSMQEFLAHALETPSAVVERVVVGDQTRIAWGLADPTTGLVVYAERAIPPDRRAAVDQNSAYADLDYAIYLGDSTELADLTTTDVDPSRLPLDGPTYSVTVPFGDTVLTLVTSPRRHLGGSLSDRQPEIALGAGLLLTLMAGVIASMLARGRREAESHSATVTGLYERVDSLYEEQRGLFVRLQRALLPQSVPTLPHIEVAADYVAGARGMDIGGDWYSVIGIDDDRFAFVVGDVSGRGLDAVAVMAQARFTLRAYLADGNSPEEALAKSSRQFDVAVDGHITTVLAGVGNCRTGEVTIANAGHPTPLLLSPGEADYPPIPVGPPLGSGPASYKSGTFTVPVGSSLLMYTDGLIERRSEGIDTGLLRLARTSRPLATVPLETLVSTLLATLRDDDASDDVALLALRRTS